MMRFYTVHENPERRDEDERIVLVREGFSWGAFFVPLLWTLHRRCWPALVLYACVAGLLLTALLLFDAADQALNYAMGAIVLGLPALVSFYPDPGIGLTALLVCALLGFEANDLRRWLLARRGYHVTAVVSGRSLLEAEAAYFTAKGQPPPASSAPDMLAPAAWRAARHRPQSVYPGLDETP